MVTANQRLHDYNFCQNQLLARWQNSYGVCNQCEQYREWNANNHVCLITLLWCPIIWIPCGKCECWSIEPRWPRVQIQICLYRHEMVTGNHGCNNCFTKHLSHHEHGSVRNAFFYNRELCKMWTLEFWKRLGQTGPNSSEMSLPFYPTYSAAIKMHRVNRMLVLWLINQLGVQKCCGVHRTLMSAISECCKK